MPTNKKNDTPGNWKPLDYLLPRLTGRLLVSWLFLIFLVLLCVHLYLNVRELLSQHHANTAAIAELRAELKRMSPVKETAQTGNPESFLPIPEGRVPPLTGSGPARQASQDGAAGAGSGDSKAEGDKIVLTDEVAVEKPKSRFVLATEE